jgi:hypothetical protein
LARDAATTLPDMKYRCITALLALAALAGCAGPNRVPMADEREAWGFHGGGPRVALPRG